MTCGSDKKVRLWNPESGLLLKTYGGHANEVTDAKSSCDSAHIISGSLDKSMIYWDVTTGQPLRRLRCHAGGISCVEFNEDSNVAFTGGRDNLVMSWDIRTRRQEKPIQTMNESKDCITKILAADHVVIVSSLDGCVRRYDVRMGELICDQLDASIVYFTQTNDGRCLLTACIDDTLRLLDNENGEILASYRGHMANDFQIECGVMNNDTWAIAGSSQGNFSVLTLYVV